jgi:hypothetical protein
MAPVATEVTTRAELMKMLYESVATTFDVLAKSFLEDGKKMGTDAFFGQIHEFVKAFRAAHRDVVARREAEAKRAAKQAEADANRALGPAPARDHGRLLALAAGDSGAANPFMPGGVKLRAVPRRSVRRSVAVTVSQ